MKLLGNYTASTIFIKRGIELDLEKGCYKILNKLFSFISLSNACLKIPKPSYVLVFRTLYAKCEACNLEDFENGSVYQLSLVYNKNRRLIIDESKEKTNIFKKAEQLAQHFKLNIRDAASDRKKPVWVTQ